MSDTYKLVYSKVINQAIKDLVCNHADDRDAADLCRHADAGRQRSAGLAVGHGRAGRRTVLYRHRLLAVYPGRPRWQL